MSDPFDAFEASMTTTTTTTTTTNADAFGDDPAADFLAREQAELDKIENTNQVSDDPFGSFNGNNDLISSTGEQTTPSTNNNLVNGFDSESNIFGDSNTNEQTTDKSNQDWIVVDENNTITNEPEQNKDVYSAIHTMDKLSIEPDKIKKWREEQRIRLETKDAEEETKKKEMKESAKKELDDWYKKRAEQLGRTHDNNKASDAEVIAARESTAGSDWERLAKLCEFNPKANKNTRDVSRMRSILLQLKQQPLVR